MSSAEPSPRSREFWVLSLGALGVVYGDIGTSPIYAIRESFHIGHGLVASAANTLGILSLIFWSLIVVISLKYLLLVMQADNDGEGGIIALTALVMPRRGPTSGVGARRALVLVGLFGAALLYGDSMITPAISVLSAIEGLEVVTPVLTPYVIPITLGILVGLFAFQKRGTAGIGAIFGPLTLLWFLVLAALGIRQIATEPSVFLALNPFLAVTFFARNGLSGMLVLGSVFLVVTGGEALYADMGHFGRRPIRLTWTFVVLPALVLNYFGQGAMIMRDPTTAEHPFFSMAPAWALLPLVGIATAATVIASQAVISGAFSLTRQAVQLGYLPRMRIDQTSEKQIGQIYMPAVNWALMFACLGLVLGFRTSGNLASAYGVAVTTDMVFTTILFAVVAHLHFKWKLRTVGLMAAGFLLVDIAFWSANLPKIPHGGWFPLVIAAGAFTLMTTWKTGKSILDAKMGRVSMPVTDFIQSIEGHPPTRVSGTAVYMTTATEGVPRALLHNLKHNKVLHERVILLTVDTVDTPRVRSGKRTDTTELGIGFHRVIARYGFAEDPDVPGVLRSLDIPGYEYEEMRNSFFLGEITIVVPDDEPAMATWRAVLFERMTRNELRASAYFRIPPNRVVGLGAQIELSAPA